MLYFAGLREKVIKSNPYITSKIKHLNQIFKTEFEAESKRDIFLTEKRKVNFLLQSK